MPSETDELLESIRRLLWVLVFLLSLGVAAVGDVAVAVRGYETLIATVARATGSLTILGMLVFLLSELFRIEPEEGN
ncbi:MULTISPECIES: hypothetical protein [Halorubrum]|uniref:Uncharacterized protein n=1 Tax=Halorubrum hochstenium ATCC 700873 TaxID=1227481 RepID=M0EY04_9EURY|nr:MULTISPECIES: hypothetical protein [Halorubrum]ELZ52681.1 hypothetical protein C467_14744 [Halorubrum hochstenium ATCC 700873]